MYDRSLVLEILDEIDYFNIDPEEILNICSNALEPLKQVLKQIREEIR